MNECDWCFGQSRSNFHTIYNDVSVIDSDSNEKYKKMSRPDSISAKD